MGDVEPPEAGAGALEREREQERERAEVLALRHSISKCCHARQSIRELKRVGSCIMADKAVDWADE